MRQIKFRMWDFENKAMIDGDSLAFEEYAPISHLLSQKGIMQFTGLTDRNGKEIYEGDIATAKNWGTQVISFKSGMFKFGNMSLVTFTSVGNEFACEIIGNIYENAELVSA